MPVESAMQRISAYLSSREVFTIRLRGGALVLLLAALLAACSRPAPDVIRLGVASAPLSLDPRFVTDATSYRLSRLIYESLVDFDDEYRFVPALASWRRRSDTEWEVNLAAERPDFHHGRRLTAADVKATYESVLDPATGSPHRGSLAAVRDIRIESPDRVVFELAAADPLFPGRLVIGIMPAELIAAGHPFARRPVGSGPFRFVAWPEAGRVRLQRRDGQMLEILRVADFTVRALKLARGELDLVQGDLPQEIVGWLSAQPGLSVRRKPGNTFAYLGFNLEDPVAGLPALREAVALAIDREAIVRSILGGGARPADALLPPDHWAGAELAGWRHAPEAARRRVRALGYGPANPVPLQLKTSTNPQRVRIAAVLQQQLRQAYIDLQVLTHEWGTFYGDIKSGRFQMYSLAWVGLKLPDIFRYAFHSRSRPPQGANRGSLADPHVDALIERAEAAPSLQRQAELYRELQAYLAEALPYVPLWYEDHVAVVRDALSDYDLLGDGTFDGLITARKVGAPP